MHHLRYTIYSIYCFIHPSAAFLEVVSVLQVSERESQLQKRRRRSKSEPHHLVHCIPPPVHADDDISNERNLSLLKEELEKPKPSPEITKDLMRRTFAYRWDSFVSCCSPPSLHEYLSQYPVLKKIAYVSVYVCH